MPKPIPARRADALANNADLAKDAGRDPRAGALSIVYRATADLSEEWRTIPGTDFYEASSAGRIRSLDRIIDDGRARKGVVLKSWPAAHGYLYINLGKGVRNSVHRLVAMAFHGMPPANLPEAAHLNGANTDNRACNLKWCGRSENESHKIAHGTNIRGGALGQPWHKKRGPRPTMHPRADEIRARRIAGASLSVLAREFDMSKSGMSGVLKKRI